MARAISLIPTEAELPGADPAAGGGTVGRPAEEAAPSGESGLDWAASLVHAAVAGRPVAEVARLFALLDSDGQILCPSPASAVAAGRPVDELSQLLAALRGAQLSRGQDILRVAVLSRSVEEVVELVAALGGRQSGAVSHALQAAALNRPVEDVVALARALKSVPPEGGDAEEPRKRRRWS